MDRTVGFQTYIYDLGSEQGAEMANAWIAKNLNADTARFEEEFPGARIVASPGAHHSPLSGASYCVFGGATRSANGWIPESWVLFAQPNGDTGGELRQLPQLGTFQSSADAEEAARKAKVSEIRADGTVVFECERR